MSHNPNTRSLNLENHLVILNFAANLLLRKAAKGLDLRVELFAAFDTPVSSLLPNHHFKSSING